jgi:hypothetical protein
MIFVLVCIYSDVAEILQGRRDPFGIRHKVRPSIRREPDKDGHADGHQQGMLERHGDHGDGGYYSHTQACQAGLRRGTKY